MSVYVARMMDEECVRVDAEIILFSRPDPQLSKFGINQTLDFTDALASP